MLSFAPDTQGPSSSSVHSYFTCSREAPATAAPSCLPPLVLPTRPSPAGPARFPLPLSGLKGSFSRSPQLLLSVWERHLAERREKKKTGVAAREGWPAGPRDRDTLSLRGKSCQPLRCLPSAPSQAHCRTSPGQTCSLALGQNSASLHHCSEPGRTGSPEIQCVQWSTL